MLGFKRFETAAVTIRGIELAEKIKKQQFNLKPLTGKATTATEIWAVVFLEAIQLEEVGEFQSADISALCTDFLLEISDDPL
jgi:hypothetical protein